MNLSLLELPTIVALAAVLVARRGIAPAAERSPVADRLLTLYGLIAPLLFFRVLDRWLDMWLLTVAIMVTAAWLPLAGLRLVEELQRRHAPRWIKLAILGGGIAFTVVAVLVGPFWSTASLIALATFQTVATVAMICLLLASRRDLTPAERRTADTFLLALLLTIPLAVSDFQALLPGLPVRGGAFAALILVLATSRLVRGDGSPAWLIADISLCLVGAALAVAAALVVSSSVPPLDVWTAASTGFLIGALVLLVERSASNRLQSSRLIGALARAPVEGGVEGLMRSHPLLSSARIVDTPLLSSYPADAIGALTRFRVVGEDVGDAEAREAARDLLDATAATHLLRLSVEPPRFLAISAGGLAGPSLNDELVVTAMLIERRT